MDFTSTSLLKKDIFSEVHFGHLCESPETLVAARSLENVSFLIKPLARIMLRREAKAISAADGIEGCPRLIFLAPDLLIRSWIVGTTLDVAPKGAFDCPKAAFQILRQLRQRGLTHNDLAKPQNWIITPEGYPALIDFQLAKYHRRRGYVFRYMAYEDFRHLLKQLRNHGKHRMTPTGMRLSLRKSWPSRLWMATGKKLYNFVTRYILDWSDGEGAGHLKDQEMEIIKTIHAMIGYCEVFLTNVPRSQNTVGIYAFIETTKKPNRKSLNARLTKAKIDFLQCTREFPRDAVGNVRRDLLTLIARNQISAIEGIMSSDDPDLSALISERKNMSDRSFRPNISSLETQ